jgi:hypothetical protein
MLHLPQQYIFWEGIRYSCFCLVVAPAKNAMIFTDGHDFNSVPAFLKILGEHRECSLDLAFTPVLSLSWLKDFISLMLVCGVGKGRKDLLPVLIWDR